MVNRRVRSTQSGSDNTGLGQDGRVRRRDSSIFDLFPSTISSQRDPQIFRTAFVHSAAVLFVLVCGACALLAYRVLEPFLRSILWSILAGAFLFPFKKHLTASARYHLRQLDTDSHLLIYGLVIVLPLRTLDTTIESVGPFCIRKWKQLLTITFFLPCIELLHTGVIYRVVTTIGYDLSVTLVTIVRLFDSLWITSLVIGYLIAVLTFYNSSPLVKTLLNAFAVPVWFILLFYLSQFLPVTYRVTVILLAIVLTAVGFVVDLRENIDQQAKQTNSSSEIVPRKKSIFSHLAHGLSEIREYYRAKRAKASLPITSSSSSSSSTPYFTFVLWALVAIKVYFFYWYLIPIPIFVIVYKLVKCFLLRTYAYLKNQSGVRVHLQQLIDFWQVRRDVLTPSPLNGLVRFLIKGDKKFNHGLQASIDYLVTAFMIVALFVTVLFASILLVIQIHHESIHMIKLTSNLVNETLIIQPSFQYLLPDREHMSHLVDTAVNKFYVTGRTWLSKQFHLIRAYLKLQINTLGQDELSNKNLEEEILQLWDRLYNYMTTTSTLLIPNRNESIAVYSISNTTLNLPLLWTNMQRNNLDFHVNDLYRLIRDNLGLLRTVLDSIWSNATLVLTLFSTIISLVFHGGFALLNFVVSFIVFVTLLFYLLSHSDEPTYRPTEWLNNTLAVGGGGLGKAVNDAVTSVFVASLKIAAFYGLYTYVLHILVGSNLVFLPAVIAAVCAVTLKSYWAALPGCLDLWLVQQRPLGALLLLLGQIAPVYVVDTAIYSEVKGGGHQYLTALAIAGGVYYCGIEGALIGPIVLCCLLVGVRLYNETMATTLSPNREHTSLASMATKRQSRMRSQSVETMMTTLDDD